MSHFDPTPAHRLERWTLRTREAIRVLPGVPFLLGLVLGFGACAFAGRIVSAQPMFERFVRFFAPIQPQRHFYPTASQLAAHIRHAVPRGKIPVIVGGASYLRGYGQNAGELWTHELQRRLGERYVVINFAIDQAPITAFGAVAFEMVAREFPAAIYVADGSPLSGAPWDGGDVYGYLFWDAYYKGLLPPSITESERIRNFGREQRWNRAGLELHLGKQIDRFAYACDLWTYLGYKRLFTVWTDEHWRDPYLARRYQTDDDNPNFRQLQLQIRADAAYVAQSEEHGRNASRARFRQDATGEWRPDAKAWAHLAGEWRNLFPEELRPRCYVVFLRGNPYFMQSFSADDRRRTELQYELGQRNLEGLGYRVVQLDPQAFAADDFLDGGHLVASGGAKIARAVAARIQVVAAAAAR